MGSGASSQPQQLLSLHWWKRLHDVLGEVGVQGPGEIDLGLGKMTISLPSFFVSKLESVSLAKPLRFTDWRGAEGTWGGFTSGKVALILLPGPWEPPVIGGLCSAHPKGCIAQPGPFWTPCSSPLEPRAVGL